MFQSQTKGILVFSISNHSKSWLWWIGSNYMTLSAKIAVVKALSRCKIVCDPICGRFKPSDATFHSTSQQSRTWITAAITSDNRTVFRQFLSGYENSAFLLMNQMLDKFNNLKHSQRFTFSGSRQKRKVKSQKRKDAIFNFWDCHLKTGCLWFPKLVLPFWQSQCNLSRTDEMSQKVRTFCVTIKRSWSLQIVHSRDSFRMEGAGKTEKKKRQKC
jgi:hypothetical protein